MAPKSSSAVYHPAASTSAPNRNVPLAAPLRHRSPSIPHTKAERLSLASVSPPSFQIDSRAVNLAQRDRKKRHKKRAPSSMEPGTGPHPALAEAIEKERNEKRKTMSRSAPSSPEIGKRHRSREDSGRNSKKSPREKGKSKKSPRSPAEDEEGVRVDIFLISLFLKMISS